MSLHFKMSNALFNCQTLFLIQRPRLTADVPQVHQAEESKQTNEEVEEQEMLAMVSEFECTDLLENSVETATARITQCMGEVR